jgi:hypothetical protein
VAVTANAIAKSIFISGDDLYMLGYQIIRSLDHAAYWKNGTLVAVPHTLGYSTAAFIDVH